MPTSMACHIIAKRGRFVWLAIVALMASCGTGIEVTEHVTDKDVKRVITQIDNEGPQATIDAFSDSLPAWGIGKKRFWVADNQVRMLLESDVKSPITDTLSIAGHVLTYAGNEIGSIYDNRETVNIIFKDEDADGKVYRYRTGKTLNEFTSAFSIPMLIDLDMVDHISRQVVGHDYFIRTPIWYDRASGQMMHGRHFIPVHIDSVLPGNAVMPVRILFTTIDTHQSSMVWMSDQYSSMKGRDFDAMFVVNDPHLQYPAISDKNWELITQSLVTEGMTKEECLLALGGPKSTRQIPDQAGMREYWYYDGGSYLYFVDGLLNQFRR